MLGLSTFHSHSLSHLRDGHVVDGAVKDRGVVIDVLDAHPQRAHVLECRPPLVRRLHRHVHQLLAVGLVAVEDLEKSSERPLHENALHGRHVRARKEFGNEFASSDAIFGRGNKRRNGNALGQFRCYGSFRSWGCVAAALLIMPRPRRTQQPERAKVSQSSRIGLSSRKAEVETREPIVRKKVDISPKRQPDFRRNRNEAN